MPKKNTASKTRAARRTLPPVKKAGIDSEKAVAIKPKTMPDGDGASPANNFLIVGIGASAGGLEALDEFFKAVPVDSGMAFVVVTHQPPSHASLLAELLGKHSFIPVADANDGVRVRPNQVYLSRPGDYLAMSDGALRLVESREPSSLRLPIDYFFRSLADDQREQAIGIVLSGTGTDGSLGLIAIKGESGMAMAQEPVSAKYPGMPESAIAAGAVDYVLRPDQMPGRLMAYAKSPLRLRHAPDLRADGVLPEAMRKILLLLRHRSRHDLSAYKTSTLRRRIERRMNVHQLKSPQQYLRYLEENAHEADLLFKDLLIGVTGFFRDPAAFVAMARKGLPGLLKSCADDAVIRVWVPACSTGEEAYSLAILLIEGMERLKKRLNVQIFGTDLDRAAIDKARAGLYSAGAFSYLSHARLARFFVKEDDAYRIRKEIRDMVVFAVQNAISDPPFTKLDLLSCRNLLIYLRAEAQQRMLALFHYALKPRGLLFLGPSESIGSSNQHFATVDKKWRIYQRQNTVLSHHVSGGFPAEPAAVGRPPEAEHPILRRPSEPPAVAAIEKLLLEQFAPASVVINEQGDISYIHGRTGDYLEPAPGRPHLNVIEMARDGLRVEMAAAVRRACAKGKAVIEHVQVKTNGGFSFVDLSVTRLAEPESLRGLLLVAFQLSPAASPPAARKGSFKRPTRRVDELERELRFTRESLRSTVAEVEASNEELKSANEELQSTNEEMQSTNEELETSKEEMQSLNEELQTVNTQLQSKIEALSEANDDMQNLLNSTSIATIFLDRDLNIKRFTDQARFVIKLIATDVGRPLADLASNLNYGALTADAAKVLSSLEARERELQTEQGDWRLVRILPYRTAENVIDGLVITILDINRLKRSEQAAKQAQAMEQSIVATMREPMLILDGKLRVVSATPSFCRFFKVKEAEIQGRLVYELGNGQWKIPKLQELLEKLLPRNQSFDNFEVAHKFPGIGRRVMLLNARRLEQQPGQPGLILLAMEDITHRPRESDGSARGE